MSTVIHRFALPSKPAINVLAILGILRVIPLAWESVDGLLIQPTPCPGPPNHGVGFRFFGDWEARLHGPTKELIDMFASSPGVFPAFVRFDGAGRGTDIERFVHIIPQFLRLGYTFENLLFRLNFPEYTGRELATCLLNQVPQEGQPFVQTTYNPAYQGQAEHVQMIINACRRLKLEPLT